MDNKITYEDATQFIEKMYPMAITDREGSYIYVNPAWLLSSSSKSIEEVLGKKAWDIIPETKVREVLNTGKPLFGEYIPKSDTFTSYIPRFASDGSLNGCYIYVIIDKFANAKALSKRINDLSNQLDFYQQELSRVRGARYSLNNIVGRSSAISLLKEQIIQAAKSTSTVLIEGETGSGKELIAHAIHAASSRQAANFVRVNCSAIPPELMESEFFGYTAGAFTGASSKGKIGRFQLAGGGSIFLDEINLLSSTIQPKFLRALQEREIDPLGGDKSIPINVRVIAASNIPLEKLVEAGSFRRDLFFRLNVIRITAPPLRSRKEDIPLLVYNLIERLNDQLGMMVQGIEPNVMKLLLLYDWPGNVRELQNAIESAMNASHSDVLCLKDFEQLEARVYARQQSLAVSSEKINKLKTSKFELEENLIKNALDKANGNRTVAAQTLGISRSVFYRKMHKFGIK